MSMPLGLDAADELKRTGRSKWLQIAAIAAGAAGLGALVWFLLFRKKGDPPGTVRRNGVIVGKEAQTVDELVNTPVTSPIPVLQTPTVHLEIGRSMCEDDLIHYNGALRSHPDLAAQIKAQAKANGCGWAG